MTREVPLDVLGDRYASDAMLKLWSPTARVILERKFFVAVMKAQHALGLNISGESIEAYERVIEVVDLDRIKAIERETRHDVNARIRAFGELAGGRQEAARGLTSRDPTDNVEQLQIRETLKLIRDRHVSQLAHFARRAREFRNKDITGRSHNVPAQTTTVGKRFAMWGQEQLIHFERLEWQTKHYPLRGIKGPMGTQQDMIQLLGSAAKALELEGIIARELGFEHVLTSVGQVYPRSLDHAVVSLLVDLGSAPSNMAREFRLMAGQGLMHEGFLKTQVGSNAMPHKMNPRTCERINGMHVILRGFQNMAAALTGDQWNEGDVSDSIVRRVLFPDTFFAIDGLNEATLTVLNELEMFPQAIEQELRNSLPLLSSTRIYTAAQQQGMGHEDAHAAIRDCAVGAVKAGKWGEFIDRLVTDGRLPMTRADIEALVSEPNHGAAAQQVDYICNQIEDVVARYPAAAGYEPGGIL